MIGRFQDKWTALRTALSAVAWRTSITAMGTGCRIGRAARFWGTRDISLGDRVTVDDDVRIGTIGRGKITVGHGTYIGPGGIFMASRNLTIGDDVSFGPRVFISTHRHAYDKPIPITLQGLANFGDVVVERGAWIAANCVVLPGVRIGECSVVAANSVVTRDVPARTIVSGCPAKLLKTLDDEAPA